jgi:predicted XRE-type DNA-binding protein
MTKRRSKHLGSTVESWLKEEGIYEEATTHAIKNVLVWQIDQAMKAEGISKSEMAKRMRTSRSQLDRFLDPDNSKVLLETVQRAATVLGKRVVISFENEPTPRSA